MKDYLSKGPPKAQLSSQHEGQRKEHCRHTLGALGAEGHMQERDVIEKGQVMESSSLFPHDER